MWCESRKAGACSARLVFAPLADLRLETSLDRVDRTPGSAGLARDEEDTVLLGKESVGGLARLARNVLDEVAAKDVLDLLLLEAALDNEAARTVD